MAIATLPNKLQVNPTNTNSGTSLFHSRESLLHHSESFLLIDEQQSMFKRPLAVSAQKIEGDNWIVTSPGILTHGYGETQDEAITDFLEMLNDLYCELKNYKDKLSSHSKREFNYLKSLLHDDSRF